ncbi:hypothetical protein M2158_004755 [Streptomyces sp. SAI-144]|nr:hypothetical protein [Streptomyces sp. SAI-144]
MTFAISSAVPRRFIGRVCAKWPKVSFGRIRSMRVSIESGTIPLTRMLRPLNSAATAITAPRGGARHG